MTQSVLISDTSLRLFIPPQVHKMTPKLSRICGCNLCTITKDMQIDLNRFRTDLLIDLKHKYIGRHILNSSFSTTRAAQYKDKVFTEVEFLYANIKYADH